MKSDEAWKVIEEYVQKMLAEQGAFIEEVCERALAGGEDGVLVVRSEGDPTTLRAGHCPLVPYRRLVDLPSEAAFDRWLENGCPL